MPLTVTPSHGTNGARPRNYIRISNDRGDTIDLDVRIERGAYLLADTLSLFAENLTIIETTKGG